MVKKEVKVLNRSGLHTRPSSLISRVSKTFNSDIFLSNGSLRVNAKSIMGVLTLGATYNSVLTLEADGFDEDLALESISNLFIKKFQEDT